MTHEQIALDIACMLRQESYPGSEVRLGLGSGERIYDVSLRDCRDDIESLAVDLAALLTVDADRERRLVVYLPNSRLCRTLLAAIYDRLRALSEPPWDMGHVAQLNRNERLTFMTNSGVYNYLYVYPNRVENLFGTGSADLVVKTNGNAAFDQSFNADEYFVNHVRRVVTLSFLARGELDAVERLNRQMEQMDLSD